MHWRHYHTNQTSSLSNYENIDMNLHQVTNAEKRTEIFYNNFPADLNILRWRIFAGWRCIETYIQGHSYFVVLLRIPKYIYICMPDQYWEVFQNVECEILHPLWNRTGEKVLDLDLRKHINVEDTVITMFFLLSFIRENIVRGRLTLDIQDTGWTGT